MCAFLDTSGLSSPDLMSHLLMPEVHIDLLIRMRRSKDVVVEVGPLDVLHALSVLPASLDGGGKVRVVEHDLLVV